MEKIQEVFSPSQKISLRIFSVPLQARAETAVKRRQRRGGPLVRRASRKRRRLRRPWRLMVVPDNASAMPGELAPDAPAPARGGRTRRAGGLHESNRRKGTGTAGRAAPGEFATESEIANMAMRERAAPPGNLLHRPAGPLLASGRVGELAPDDPAPARGGRARRAGGLHESNRRKGTGTAGRAAPGETCD